MTATFHIPISYKVYAIATVTAPNKHIAKDRATDPGAWKNIEENKTDDLHTEGEPTKQNSTQQNILTINDIDNRKIKKELNAKYVHFRWHNKNKSGGNFGINIIYSKKVQRPNPNRELTGEYNEHGTIISLKYGERFQAGMHVPRDAAIDLGELIAYMKDVEQRVKEERAAGMDGSA